MEKKKALFLCTENSARSQMAEGLLRLLGNDRFEVYSAGLNASAVHPYAIEVMREIGIDISHHTSKSVRHFLGKISMNHVIFVCADAEESCPKIWPGVVQKCTWPIDDPTRSVGSDEEVRQNFRIARDQLHERIRTWLRDEPSAES